METKCSVLILFVCLAYGASALPILPGYLDNSQSIRLEKGIDHEQSVEQKSGELYTESVGLSSTSSTIDGFFPIDYEESTGTNEVIDSETTENVATKENAKDLIMAALVQDDADQTKALIEELSGNFSGIDDIVWLGKASEKCKLNVAKMLIENGVSVEVHKPDNWHPLQVAAYNGCDEVAKFLIENGADLNIENGVGSPLSIAKNRGNDKIVDLLLVKIKSGAETSFVNPLHIAQHNTTVFIEHTEKNVNQKVVENAEQKGEDMILNAILKDDEKDTEKQIENLIAGYLKVAAEKCKPKVAKMFIQNGVNVTESYGERKWRLLHFATHSECEEMVKILLDNGADIDVKTGTGYTALHLAAKNGNAKIIEFLIRKGADIEIKDSDYFAGWTALEWAQMKNHAAAVKVLIDNGAKQPKRDIDYIIDPYYYDD